MAVFRVWYMRPDWFREGSFGGKPNVAKLEETHVHLRDISVEGIELVDEDPEEGLEFVYHQSQGEIWSPNGEARELIKEKELGHTSMSVGDVIEQDGRFWLVVAFGFSELRAR